MAKCKKCDREYPDGTEHVCSLQEEQKKPDTIAVIIPKQIAQRVVAQSPHSNLLAVSVQLYGKPKL